MILLSGFFEEICKYIHHIIKYFKKEIGQMGIKVLEKMRKKEILSLETPVASWLLKLLDPHSSLLKKQFGFLKNNVGNEKQRLFLLEALPQRGPLVPPTLLKTLLGARGDIFDDLLLPTP